MVKVVGSLAEFQKEIQGPGLVVVDFYAGTALMKIDNIHCNLHNSRNGLTPVLGN